MQCVQLFTPMIERLPEYTFRKMSKRSVLHVNIICNQKTFSNYISNNKYMIIVSVTHLKIAPTNRCKFLQIEADMVAAVFSRPLCQSSNVRVPNDFYNALFVELHFLPS